MCWEAIGDILLGIDIGYIVFGSYCGYCVGKLMGILCWEAIGNIVLMYWELAGILCWDILSLTIYQIKTYRVYSWLMFVYIIT